MTIATLCQNHSRRRVHEWRQQAVQAGRLQQHDSVTGRYHSRYGRAAHRLRRQRARRKPSHLFHTTPHVCTWRRILWRFFVKYFVLDLCHGCGSGMIRARQRAACREQTLASRLTARDITWISTNRLDPIFGHSWTFSGHIRWSMNHVTSRRHHGRLTNCRGWETCRGCRSDRTW